MKVLKFEKINSRKFKIFAIIFILIISYFLSITNINAQENIDTKNDVHLHLFYGQGCPHCGNLRSFLDNLKGKYPSLNIYEHEVYQNNEERKLFEKMSRDFNTPIEGVPTVFIDNKVIVGFSNAVGVSIENEIKRCLEIECGNPEFKCSSPDLIKSIENKSPSDDPKKIEIAKKLTVPIVIFAAAVDAINPCAFAVLIILMTAALAIVDKKKALKFGFAFSASIYISYFLMGLGLFSALQASSISHTFYIVVTILAVIVGLFNIKDYFWYGKGFLMEVPLSWRPAMKKMINSATTPFGAFVAGFAVSLFELPCTGGPYIVILGLLAEEVTKSIGILYLLLYNLVFISPLIILSFIIYKGFSTTSQLEAIRQEKIKVLHLIAGILMLIIAIIMIISLINGWV
jgi:cytochrome c biogenesis protein CcdA/glutaredoxin